MKEKIKGIYERISICIATYCLVLFFIGLCFLTAILEGVLEASQYHKEGY